MKNREEKKQEAENRQKTYDELTLAQKTEKLDRKLGVGVGAKKERAKLLEVKN